MAIAFLSNWPRRIVAAGLLSVGACALAQTAAPKLPDAAATDPVAMGWMVGFPPPADRVIRFADGSSYRFPQLRWSFSNYAPWCPPAMSRAGSTPRCRCRAPSATTSTASASARWATTSP